MRRYIFLLISGGGLLFATIPNLVQGQFTFAFDMGRDLLWVRNMVELHRPTLIGPWGSIAGVYFGPLWYYLLAIPYLITGGDPRGSVLVPLIGNLATLIAGWWWLGRRGQTVAANIWAILFGFSLLAINLSSYPFHANLLPLVTLLYLIGLVSFISISPPVSIKPHPSTIFLHLSGLPLASLMASLAYHLEPAAGVMLTAFLLVWLLPHLFKLIKSLYNRYNIYNPYSLILATLLFVIPFSPQLLFELRHNFIQTKSLVAYFRGDNPSLGGVLPLAERIPERITKLSGILSHSLFPLESPSSKWLLLFLYLLLILLLLYRSPKHKFSDNFTIDVFQITLLFLAFHYLAYTFLFPAELKGWYLSGFLSVYLLAAALIFQSFWHRGKRIIKFSLITLITLISLINTQPWRRIFPVTSPAAPDTLAAQLEVVDWIYRDASSRREPFSVYTYTPPIYDYSTQYLLWWRGRQRGVLPAEYSYQPGKNDYLPESSRFASTTWQPKDAKYTYLIIEPDQLESRRHGWLGNFASYPLLWEYSFSSGILVQVRSPR